MQNFIDRLLPVAEKYAESHNLNVYEITLRSERSGKVLRVNLEGSVTLEQCADISRSISEWIDSLPEDTIPYSNYTLEVSSLGLDRPLRSAKDFTAQMDKLCSITTKTKDETGRKRYKGIITAVTQDAVTIFTKEENKSFTLPIKDVAKANVEIELE
jgi:ribosome maturation factor RimP